VVRRYDVLALEPATERAFASACNNKRVDLIALQLGVRMPFRMRPPALKVGRCRLTLSNPNCNRLELSA